MSCPSHSPSFHHFSRYSSVPWFGQYGDRIPVGASLSVHIGPEVHPAPCTICVCSFPGTSRPECGTDHLPPSSAVLPISCSCPSATHAPPSPLVLHCFVMGCFLHSPIIKLQLLSPITPSLLCQNISFNNLFSKTRKKLFKLSYLLTYSVEQGPS
jgi:hypothetical protein